MDQYTRNFQPDMAAKKTLQEFAKKLHLGNYTVNVFNDYSEEEGILHFADSIEADLIAMATHGRTGFAHVMVGSIAESIANRSKRPVFKYVTKMIQFDKNFSRILEVNFCKNIILPNRNF